MKKYILLLLFIPLMSCSISYKFNSATLNYAVLKTISITDFPIKAALVYPPLAPVFNQELKNMFTRQTRLNMVKNNGDLQIEGEITGYDLTPQAVMENAYASQTRLTISVKVRYTNTKEPQKDMEQTFSAYKDFSSSELLTNVQDELIKIIVEDLTNQIFNATVGSW